MQKLLVVALVLAILAVAVGVFSRTDATRPTQTPLIESTPQVVRLGDVTMSASLLRLDQPTAHVASGDTSVLAHFDFEDGMGGADAQGWTVEDLSYTDVFWHVDDFVGLPSQYQSLEGSQSMWCGLRPDSVLYADWATLPGYGNRWVQTFRSQEFSTTGDLTVSFLFSYDTEPGYDYFYVEYLNASDQWVNANPNGQTVFDGIGDTLVTAVVNKANLGPTVSVRLRFQSDPAWSDQDGAWDTNGAAIVDSLWVGDSLGVINFQDFENETVGDLATLDGFWSGDLAFGEFAGLFDGSSVLQEDSAYTNTSRLWGFFAGSPDDYTCGGFPAQAVVPHATTPESRLSQDYFHNELQSPAISLSTDTSGAAVSTRESVQMSFDIYTDLPVDNLVFFRWRVRSLVGGLWTDWQTDEFLYHDPDKEWKRPVYELFPYVHPEATHIQVAIGAADYCYLFCDALGSGACHSQGPLIDNITIRARSSVDLVVTTTADAGPGSLRQAIVDANLSPDRNTISFAIPGMGPHDIFPETDLPQLSSPVVVDGKTQPGYTGTPMVGICGGDSLTYGLWFDGNRSRVQGIAITGFEIGVWFHAEFDTLFDSWVGVRPDGIPGANEYGIRVGDFSFVSGGNSCIGGPEAGKGNQIAYNREAGIFLWPNSGTGHHIRGNSIHSNGGRGIVLSGSAPVANDLLDVDGGPNLLQNYPIMTAAYSTLYRVEGTLNSAPDHDFWVDIFANAECDTTGNGEGERYLGSTQVTTNSVGDAVINVVVDAFAVGEVITATASDQNGNTSEFSACLLAEDLPTSAPEVLPATAMLYQNWPNPFNPTTTIRYDVPRGGSEVTLAIFDVRGTRIVELVNEHKAAGAHRVQWNGLTAQGQQVATGVYFLRLQTNGVLLTRKMVVIK